jgi:hypothetical protein
VRIVGVPTQLPMRHSRIQPRGSDGALLAPVPLPVATGSLVSALLPYGATRSSPMRLDNLSPTAFAAQISTISTKSVLNRPITPAAAMPSKPLISGSAPTQYNTKVTGSECRLAK